MCAHRSCADRAELYTGPGNSRQLQRWTTKEKPCCSTTKCTRPRATCISRRVCWPRPSTTILRFCRFHQNHNGYDNKAIRSCYGAILHWFISTIRRAVKSALFPIEPVWIYAFIASHIHGHIVSSVWRIRITGSTWHIATLAEEDRATVTCISCTKIWWRSEVQFWRYASGQTDTRKTHKYVYHSTPLPRWGGVMTATVWPLSTAV